MLRRPKHTTFEVVVPKEEVVNPRINSNIIELTEKMIQHQVPSSSHTHTHTHTHKTP